jgi:plasmid maintenance system antidote protein VapI
MPSRKLDIPLVHPGKILKTDLLQPLGLTVNALSKAIKVPRAA